MRYLNAYALAGSLMYGLGESIIDNLLLDNVSPIPGSLVYCDLWCLEHSGIAISDTEIVHLNGDGLVEVVSHKTFRARLWGFNNAMSIYVSSFKDSSGNVDAVGSKAVAKRAEGFVHRYLDYSIFGQNCHTFASQCLMGSPTNIYTFTRLKHLSNQLLQANTWRVAK